MEKNKIYCGDSLEVLKTFPDECIDCCVTSPPYWKLRDYGIESMKWPEVEFIPMIGLPAVIIPSMECCHGLEPDPMSYISHEVLIFREVRRALKKDGTLWLNLGDSYCAAAPGARDPKRWPKQSRNDHRGQSKLTCGLKPKDLCGIPWRAAVALQADGWYLRSDIIWSKPNPIPESVVDRPAKAHEYVFLLSKSSQYYYDSDAIREKLKDSSIERLSQPNIENQKGSDRVPGKTNGPMKAVYSKKGGISKSDYIGRSDGKSRPPMKMVDREYNPLGRNKRTVWEVSTMPYKKAHFATFPPKLIEPMILAGCPEGGIVLDPFMGSGTTAITSRKLARNYVGIELNPEYIPMIEKRLEQDYLF